MSVLVGRVQRGIVAAAAVAVTLAVWPNLDDPVNVPKIAVLLLVSLLTVPFLAKRASQIWRTPLGLLLGLFALALLIATVFSDLPSLSIWAMHARNNGLVAYLSLALLFALAATIDRSRLMSTLVWALVSVGVLTAIYALFQAKRIDFIKWNTPYNPAIATFGNPNFSAAFFAILLSALTFMFFAPINRNVKFALVPAFAIGFWAVIATDSLQGILAFGVALIFTSIVILWRRNSQLGKEVAAVAIVVTPFVAAGLLGRGPLHAIEQETMSIRLNYWRAAIRMMLDKPFTGVGLGRYGDYFTQFRDSRAIAVGNDVFTDAAHNVYLQFGATGGFPLLLSYLALQLFVLITAIKRIVKSESLDFVDLSLFAAWIAFQSQSLISIDQLALTIWGWVIGGALIARTYTIERKEEKKRRQQRVESEWNWVGVGLAGAGLILAFANLVPIWKIETQIKQIVAVKDLRSVASADIDATLNRVLNLRARESYYPNTASLWLSSRDQAQLTQKYADRALAINPRSRIAIRILAEQAYYQSRPQDEERYIKQGLALDPLNTDLLVRAADLAVARQDVTEAKRLLEKVLAINPESSQGQDARDRLARL